MPLRSTLRRRRDDVIYLRLLRHLQEKFDSLPMAVMLISLDNMPGPPIVWFRRVYGSMQIALERRDDTGHHSSERRNFHRRWAFAAGAVLCACMPTSSFADEGGVSFWLPGLFGSLAATPLQPGLTFSSTYYHTSVTGEGDVSRAREITVGRFPINFSGSANLQLNSAANLGIFNAIYTLPTPVWVDKRPLP